MDESAREIKGLQKLAVSVLGEEDMCSKMLNKSLDGFAKNLEYTVANMQ